MSSRHCEVSTGTGTSEAAEGRGEGCSSEPLNRANLRNTRHLSQGHFASSVCWIMAGTAPALPARPT